MSAVSGGGNYISDSQIMEWLAVQQDRIYGDLRGSMEGANDRGKFIEDLNQIKSEIHDANREGKGDFSQVLHDIKAFKEQYGSDPQFQQICEDLNGMFQSLHDGAGAAKQYKKDYKQYEADHAAWQAQQPDQGPDYSTEPQPPEKPGPQHYDDGQLKDWDEQIGAKIDSLNKNDQLGMIHIQELRSTLDQGSQMASSFISSGDKTSSAIINNIA